MSRWQRPSANPNMHEFLPNSSNSANGSGASEAPDEVDRSACFWRQKKERKNLLGMEKHEERKSWRFNPLPRTGSSNRYSRLTKAAFSRKNSWKYIYFK